MTLHYNRTPEREKRRSLRNAASAAESKLWWRLRGKQLGAKFRRQHSIDAYIVDFYAPSCKLAVEVDGDSHFTAQAVGYDAQRTAHLARFGIEVLRFANTEVFENIEAVLEAIAQAVKPRNHPQTPPW
jgi:very-short-patch-repair endonuclease